MRLAAKGAVEVWRQQSRGTTYSSVVSRVSPVSHKVGRVGAVGDEKNLERDIVVLVWNTDGLTGSVWESIARVGSSLRLPVGVWSQQVRDSTHNE